MFIISCLASFKQCLNSFSMKCSATHISTYHRTLPPTVLQFSFGLRSLLLLLLPQPPFLLINDTITCYDDDDHDTAVYYDAHQLTGQVVLLFFFIPLNSFILFSFILYFSPCFYLFIFHIKITMIITLVIFVALLISQSRLVCWLV